MSTINPYYNTKYNSLNTNFSFQGENFSNSNEIALQNSLNEEAGSIYGLNAYYLFKDLNTFDFVFGESIGATFKNSIPLHVVPTQDMLNLGEASVMGFGFSPASQLELEVDWSYLRRQFQNYAPEGRMKPCVGDLIYIPAIETLWEINFVNEKVSDFQNGFSRIYRFLCSLYDKSNSSFNISETENTELTPENIKNVLDSLNSYNEQYSKPYNSNEIVQNELDKNAPDEEERYPSTWTRNQLNTNLLDEILVKGK